MSLDNDLKQFRTDVTTVQNNIPWFRWTIGIFGFIIVIGFIANLFGVFGTIITTPGKLVTKTLNPDNIIFNYERFHDMNASYEARVAQVAQFKGLMASEQDAGERSRLRIETTTIQQSCRDLVTEYNADSTKINRTIFKGKSLPYRLEISSCE